MMEANAYYSASEDDPDLTEVCLVGGDLTEFNPQRLGPGLRKLDLSFNVIKRLKGLESSASTLEEVILDNNQLQRIELRTTFPKLHTLSLNKNVIVDIVSLLNTLKSYAPSLRYLSLLGNPTCPDKLTVDDVDESDYQKYRYFIIHHLPGLRFLDHRAVTKHEYQESQRTLHSEIDFYQQCSPLPPAKLQAILSKAEATDSNSISKSKHGRRKYKYIGKNSEGNRFIKDTDL